MKVRVYFCKELGPEVILKGGKISRLALHTIYELFGKVNLRIFLMLEEFG